MIKMIVSDLDGTILHKDFSYSKRTIQALHMALAKGIVFLPATGRPFQDIKDIFHKEGICCDAICVNGALACNASGSILSMNDLSSTIVKNCIRVFQSYDFSIQIFTAMGVYAYQDKKEVARNFHKVVCRNMEKNFPYIENDVLYEHDLDAHSILKLETMSLDDKRLALCMQELKTLSTIDVTSSIHGNIEITHKNSTKGAMLEKLLSHYQMHYSEVLIFGDSYNDISLFTRFPNTIAVGNANDTIKEYAKGICDTCEADGVAKYIEGMLCR